MNYKHKQPYHILSVMIFLFFHYLFFMHYTPQVALAENFDDAFENLDKAFEEEASKMNQDFDEKAAAMEKAWDEEEKRINEEWEKLKKAVEQKWDSFTDSSKKVWVDYDAANQETRSQVDFEKGKVIVEALVPVKTIPKDEDKDKGKDQDKGKDKDKDQDKDNAEPDELGAEKQIQEKQQKIPQEKPKAQIIKEAQPKIEQQLKKILAKEEKTGQETLADQIKNQHGQTVDEKNAQEFMQKEVLPKVTVEGKSFQSKDGIERIKVKVEIPMVPRHLRIRAEKYQELIIKYAKEYELDPCLLFAVTETESYFNPLAKSHAGAYGLMQLIPRFGAREAYQYLYKKDIIITPTQLYIPGVNVCLGGAYLKILKNRYYGNILDSIMNQYLSIASYNWGPTAVRSKIVNRCDLKGMDHNELFTFIRQNSPQETTDYLKRVTERMPKYQIMLP